MTVNELTREQIEVLKQGYLFETRDSVSYDELAHADDIVSDEDVIDFYSGYDFTEEDFGN